VARAAGIGGEEYAPIERAWAARTPSRAARTSSRELGRGLLRLAATLWPGSAPIARLSRSAGWSRPVVLGAVAAHAGIDAETLVRLAIYDDMACAVAALLKLEPGDPIDGVRLVIEACASVDTFTPQLAALTSPEAIPAASAPQSEVWAEAHAVTNRRLFRA
jgi:urease accessory protein